MRLTTVALGGLLAAAAVAAGGQEGRQWIGQVGPEGASLTYGTPQSDDGIISFACDRATKELVVWFPYEPGMVPATDGMTLAMDLFSEGIAGSILLNATGYRMELDDIFVLEAKTKLDPLLQRILTEGETLSVMVEDGVEEIPLSGAAEQAAGLFEACA